MGDPETATDTTPTPLEDKNGAQPQQESKLGQDWVGLPGVLAIIVYLVMFAVGDLYVLVKVWPPAPPAEQSSTKATPTPAPSPTPTPAPSPSPTRAAFVLTAAPSPTPSPSPAGGDQKRAAGSPIPTPIPPANQNQESWTVEFFWGTYDFATNSALFLIVLLCGAMGALLHSLRSFYWYTGNRSLKRSWAAMYILLPFNGALLATVFYLIVRGGFMPQGVGNSSTFAFAALGALVGLFSQEATLKLKQIAETIFTRVPPGKDTATPPKISGISPATGPQTGGTNVTITGTNFIPGMKVNFGGKAATSVVVQEKTSATAVTPPHAAEAVDVEVINPDNQKDVRSKAFTYV